MLLILFWRSHLIWMEKMTLGFGLRMEKVSTRLRVVTNLNNHLPNVNAGFNHLPIVDACFNSLKLWVPFTPSKVKNFIWRVLQNCLLILENLQRRHVDIASCPIYKAATVTIEYVLCFCVGKGCIWTFKIPLVIQLDNDQFICFTCGQHNSGHRVNMFNSLEHLVS